MRLEVRTSVSERVLRPSVPFSSLRSHSVDRMRWRFILCSLAACIVCSTAACTTETTVAPVTIVRVELAGACDNGGCAAYEDLYPLCGHDVEFIEPTTERVDAYASDDVTGIVQLQYVGPAVTAVADPDPPHIDHMLWSEDPIEVVALFDYGSDYSAVPLYRIDASGNVRDINAGLLEAASDRTLRFTYTAGDAQKNPLPELSLVTEQHTIGAPRDITLDLQDPGACCSVARPRELGLILLALLFGVRRRRRGARARPCPARAHVRRSSPPPPRLLAEA